MAATPQALKKLYDQKVKFINSSLSGFDNDLKKLQVRLFDYLIGGYIVRLDVVGGQIVTNQKNARLLLELDKYLAEFKDNFAVKTFGKLGNDMLKMTGLTSKYFQMMIGSKVTIDRISKRLGEYRAFVGIAENGSVLKGSFIDHLAKGNQMQTVLSSYIQRSVEGGADYKSFLKGFKDLIKGSADVNGAYERYAGGYAHDAFFSQSQQQDNFFADQLGLDYFIYEASAIEKTRPFCRARFDKVFSREQGEEWNMIDWQGKIPDVDFFVQRGGYNCRHLIRWITKDLAEYYGIEPEIIDE